jgi:hypothetical protein
VSNETDPSGSYPAGRRPILPATTSRPLDVDGTTSVAVGTALWAVAGLVLLVFFRDDLAADGREWWLWTCLAGVGTGLLGWTYCRRRRDRVSDPAGR